MRELTIAKAKAGGFLPQASLLQFRGVGAIARAIMVAGRGGYSHSAMVVYWWGDAYCCEARELKGCRAVTLASQVRRHSGRIDVYKPDYTRENFHHCAAAKFMRRLAGRDYGYLAVAQAAVAHAPLLRCFFPPADDTDDLWDRRPPFCSQAVAMAYRAGGVDPVPNLADRMTEPNDLSRSAFFRYSCTLVAE